MLQITVRDLFERLGSFPEDLNYACFSPQELTPRSPVIVFDSDAPTDDGDDSPAEAVEQGLTVELELADIEGIVSNARQQGLEPTLTQFVEGLKYYLAHDVYMEWRDWRDDPRYWPRRRPSTQPVPAVAALGPTARARWIGPLRVAPRSSPDRGVAVPVRGLGVALFRPPVAIRARVPLARRTARVVGLRTRAGVMQTRRRAARPRRADAEDHEAQWRPLEHHWAVAALRA